MSLLHSASTSGETNEPWPSADNPRKLEFIEKFKALVSRYSVDGLQAEEEISVGDLIYNEKESRRMLRDLINVDAKNFQENNQAAQNGTGDGKEAEWKWIHLPANAQPWAADLFLATTKVKDLMQTEKNSILDFFAHSYHGHEGKGFQNRLRLPSFEMLQDAVSKSSYPETFSLVLPYIDTETKEVLDRLIAHGQDHNVKKPDFNVPNTLHQSYLYGLEDKMGREKDPILHRYKKEIEPKKAPQAAPKPAAPSAVVPSSAAPNTTAPNIAATNAAGSNSTAPNLATPDKVAPDAATSNTAATAAPQASNLYRQYKQTKAIEDEDDPCDIQMLMVNQLWLWKFDSKTLITAFPTHWQLKDAGPSKDALLAQISKSLNTSPVATLDAMITRIIRETIRSIDKPYKSGLDETLLHILKKSVSSAEHAEILMYDDFSKSRLYDRLNASSKFMDSQQEIKELRDELRMIREVLKQQNDVVGKLDSFRDPVEHSKDLNFFVTHLGQINSLDENTRRIEGSLNCLIDLNYKHVTVYRMERQELLLEWDPRGIYEPVLRIEEQMERLIDSSMTTNHILNMQMARTRAGNEKTLVDSIWKIVSAGFGALSLLIPMLIMILHPGLLTALLTTSIFVLVVTTILAVIMQDAGPKDIVGATAAYAAVLVVFVGTSGSSPSGITSSGDSTGEDSQSKDSSGLSNKAIAGIVVGSIVGASIPLLTIGTCLILAQKKRWEKDDRRRRSAASHAPEP